MKHEVEVIESATHIVSFRVIKNNTIVGEAMLQGDWIFNVDVKPEYRRQGIGTAIVQKAMEYGGCELSVEDGNRDAYEFYLTLGFKPVGRIEDNGILYTIMWRS